MSACLAHDFKDPETILVANLAPIFTGMFAIQDLYEVSVNAIRVLVATGHAIGVSLAVGVSLKQNALICLRQMP